VRLAHQDIVENLDLVFNRGDHIELLVQKSDNMLGLSNDMKHSAVLVKRLMHWRRLRGWLLVLLLALLFATICAYRAYRSWR